MIIYEKINMKILLGFWMSDLAFNPEERSVMEFKEDGRLIHTIVGEKSDHIILLTYRTENNMLITDQPSHPKEERADFCITPEDKLILVHDNKTFQYIRVPD